MKSTSIALLTPNGKPIRAYGRRYGEWFVHRPLVRTDDNWKDADLSHARGYHFQRFRSRDIAQFFAQYLAEHVAQLAKSEPVWDISNPKHPAVEPPEHTRWRMDVQEAMVRAQAAYFGRDLWPFELQSIAAYRAKGARGRGCARVRN